jgi:hypothetical protein
LKVAIDQLHIISGSAYDDPTLCTSCQKPMKIIAAIAREQEDVIERVLRHLHLWDPPWKRPRKARGPPPTHGPSSREESAASASRSSAEVTQGFEENAEAEDIDPTIEDDLYAIDPAPQEDDEPPA